MDRTGAAGWKVSLFRQLTRLFTPVDRGERGRWIGGSGEVRARRRARSNRRDSPDQGQTIRVASRKAGIFQDHRAAAIGAATTSAPQRRTPVPRAGRRSCACPSRRLQSA